MSPTLDQIVPDGTSRRIIYRIFAGTGLVLGATQVGFASAQAGQPVWLTVALAVYAFLGAAGFTVSQANTPTAADQRQAFADAADLANFRRADVTTHEEA